MPSTAVIPVGRHQSMTPRRSLALSATLLAILVSSPAAMAGEAPVAVQVAEKGVFAGAQPFSVGAKRSANYELLAVPQTLAGATWVRGSDGNPRDGFSFTVDRPVTVYLFVHRNGGNPSIPRDWVKTRLGATFGQGSTPAGRDVIYRKDFPAGAIEVPGNPGLSKEGKKAMPNLAVAVAQPVADEVKPEALAAAVAWLAKPKGAFKPDGSAFRRIDFSDWTVQRGFAPDLVNYAIDAPADGGRGLRLFNADGDALPVQVTPAGQGKATLSFVAEVPPGGASTYWLAATGQGETAPPAVSATTDDGVLVLANQLLAVKVPALQEKTFATPVAADTLPAPLLAFRGADAVWKGEGKLLSQRPVAKFTVTQTATGPVFTAIRYRLEYAGGGWYEATVQVTDRAPLAEVREAYDLGQVGEKCSEFWSLDLSKGWDADASEHMNVAGQAFVGVTYQPIEQDAVGAGGTQATDFDLSGQMAIHHDSCWGSRYKSYYGIHQAAARAADEDDYPLAMVAPLHKGEWRRAESLPIEITGRQVRIRFPMDAARISFKTNPGTDTGPFSCHEHDPDLPESLVRRVWGLVLAPPALPVTAPKGHGSNCLGYAIRNLYGTVGLDRFKDFVLDWPEGKVTYPRVFITPEDAERYRAAVQADPQWKLATFEHQKMPVGTRYFYVLTGDPAVAQQEVSQVITDLDEAIVLHTAALSVGHHHANAVWGLPLAHAESVLSWPDLPAESRTAIRRRLALLSYLLTDPDVTSAGNGSHHGNPNMGLARLSDRSNVAALIPDHPMHRAWADYMGEFLAYKMGSFMAPEGGWFEYGVSYHMHGYGKVARGLMGALADKVPAAAQIWNYNRLDLDYYLNLLSPVDTRFGSRLNPGMANSPTGNPAHLVQLMGTVAGKDPAFAANLRWGWDVSGQMIGSGADMITVPAMARPQIPAQEPKLTTRSYPGFGVIFRAHQGPDETCLYLRSGYLWSHWNFDQGNLILYSKGAALLPPQPYQYDSGKIDRAFPDKNFLHFGDPANDMVYAWPDSNIVDSAFGDSVDYARHSTGYPDWYFTPGSKPGLGKPLPRSEAPGTTDGAFHWDRQVAFLKSPDPKGANYFVLRDTVNGPGKAASWFNLSVPGLKQHITVAGEKVAVDTEWPTKLEVIFPGRPDPAFEMKETRLPSGFVEDQYFTFSRPVGDGKPISRDYVLPDGSPVFNTFWTGQRKDAPDIWDYFIAIAHNPAHPEYVKNTYAFNPKMRQSTWQQVTMRLPNAPGQEVAWLLYPRGAGEAAPVATSPAPGVTKVVTGEGTDYVFLAPESFTWTGEGVSFTGAAGAVRVGKDGKTTLILSAGPGKVGYQDAVIASAVPFQKTVAAKTTEQIAAPACKIAAAAQPVTVDGEKVRFVVAERRFVELTHGTVGVRGVGPFDLTFTPTGITGTVDGDIRTLVCTWPEQIVRPGYWMDGVRWYAGFADEPAISKGQKTPQFSLAFGVSAGARQVQIGEWTWPAMPPVPARAALPAK
jgi:hypothetical protein